MKTGRLKMTSRFLFSSIVLVTERCPALSLSLLRSHRVRLVGSGTLVEVARWAGCAECNYD